MTGLTQEAILADIESKARAAGISIRRLCALANVHPTTFSRWKKSERNPEPFGASMHSIERLYLALPLVAEMTDLGFADAPAARAAALRMYRHRQQLQDIEASVVDRQHQSGADCVREGLKLLGRGVRLIAAQLGGKVIRLCRGRGWKAGCKTAAGHDVREGEQLQRFNPVGQVGLHRQSPSSGRGIEPSAGEFPHHRLSETPE